MEKVKKQLVLRKDDYETLIACLRSSQGRAAFDRQNMEDLETELKKANLVNKDDFPSDVVRLNSVVKVTPDKADIKQRKISVMAPIGTALIGFQKGEKVKWQVPSGNKTFTIMEVINQYE